MTIHPFFHSKRDYFTLRYYPKQLKHWYQRARYGVSFADEWSLDSHIMSVLLHSIPKFKNSGKYGKCVNFTAEEYRERLWCYQWDDTCSKPSAELEAEAFKFWDDFVDGLVQDFSIESFADNRPHDALVRWAEKSGHFWW